MNISKILFLNSPQIYDGEFSQIGSHQIRLIFESELPSTTTLLSGLYLINEHNGFIQTRREDYRYIYRMYEEYPSTIELCDDGIEYVESSELPEDPISFKEILDEKINELSSVCQYTIESGLTINDLHYSYTEKDQINLNDIVSTVKLTGLPLGYHADGQNCTEYSAEELMNIYIQLAMNKYCQQTYFNQSREYLKSLEESDKSREIVESYTYGTPLTGVYLETYNNMVDLYNAQILAIINNKTNEAKNKEV